MAIVTGPDYEERAHYTAVVCAACQKPPTTYPYLFWSAGGGDFVLCGECCHSLKRGLIADLIHIGAIMDMRDCGYRHFTLEKKLMPATGGNPTRRVNPRVVATLRQAAKGYE
jgi:hypothetical protein